MKKIISVLMLICLLASMFTLSAFADGELTVSSMRVVHPNENREGYNVAYSNPEYEKDDPKIIAKDPKQFWVELYCGDTHLATATPKLESGSDFSINNSGHLVVSSGKSATSALFVLNGSDKSGSWDVTWHVIPNENRLPNRGKVFVDGMTGDSGEITVNETQDGPATNMISITADFVAVDSTGQPVMFTNSLAEAVAETPNNGVVLIREAGEFMLPEVKDKLVNFFADGVVAQKITLKSDVPVADNPNIVFGAGIVVIAPPPPPANPYGVPSTADNSNMPLWTALFIGFAAVAFLTVGKKRRS